VTGGQPLGIVGRELGEHRVGRHDTERGEQQEDSHAR